ncbi:MAG TPA: STAS domain-containing protein [Clostridia bacterium]|nr:STAS domain-containing protein [Clostridia bacterium]
MTFALKESKSGEKFLLQAEGEIDVYTSSQLKEKINALLDNGVKELVIDLSNVSYIDSTGLGIFIGTLRNLKERGGRMELLSPTPRVKKVLNITGLDRVFDIKYA